MSDPTPMNQIDDSELDRKTRQLQECEISMAEFKDYIRSETLKARVEGELAGRSDELVKLSDWGKTIDDQWNAHFKKRLSELQKGKVD